MKKLLTTLTLATAGYLLPAQNKEKNHIDPRDHLTVEFKELIASRLGGLPVLEDGISVHKNKILGEIGIAIKTLPYSVLSDHLSYEVQIEEIVAQFGYQLNPSFSVGIMYPFLLTDNQSHNENHGSKKNQIFLTLDYFKKIQYQKRDIMLLFGVGIAPNGKEIELKLGTCIEF